MSEKKKDKGKLFKKLHGLQKLFTRFSKNGKKDEAKLVEVKEKHLIE